MRTYSVKYAGSPLRLGPPCAGLTGERSRGHIRARGRRPQMTTSPPGRAIPLADDAAVSAWLPRAEASEEAAEHELGGALHENNEMLLSVIELPSTQEVRFKTVAEPSFDEIGQVLLSLSVTGPGHRVALGEAVLLGRRVRPSGAIATRPGRHRLPGAETPPRLSRRRTG